MFASTLDRIPISVRCVFSIIVVLNDKFALLLAAHANKNMIRTEEARLQNHVLLVKKNTPTFNFYRGLDCARKNESIIYFPTICAS